LGNPIEDYILFTENATSISIISRLPNGVTAVLGNNGRITVSGTPTEPGQFLYAFLVLGNCGATRRIDGIITVSSQ
jgi:hypothetical protein